jgi:hypothetical protein
METIDQAGVQIVKRMRIIWIVGALVGLTGCARVQPWKRDKLAEPIMLFDADPVGKGIQEHHLDYREGSSGGTGAQAGGCGCG